MNIIKLTHPFVNKCPDIDELLLSDNDVGVVNTINTFCGRLNKLSKLHTDKIEESNYKGWGFEMLAEYMVKSDGSDNRIGIYDYVPITEAGEDVGADGWGRGEDGFPATVQVKYRQGNYVLTNNADSLSNLLAASWANYNVPLESNKNMLIITSGLKVDENTMERMLKGKVRVLNREDLRHMFDNRPEWWKRFYESVRDSRTQQKSSRTPLTLRAHQLEAGIALREDPNGKGKIILPTGTGKHWLKLMRSVKKLWRKGRWEIIHH